MKKKDIPHDKSALESYTRELQYVQNDDGSYTTGLSEGWDIKKDALDSAWVDINERIEEAREAVENGEKSPIAYYMELKLMDMPVLAGYTGFWSFNIKRHMKPGPFKRLSDKKLQKYADAFEITLEELKNFGN